ncbi:helix-turn-helix transcriptional regulator [Roseimaritima sediminicola]|uniref:helix-turn-helix transcriptional regulator n=1 Tax=Roseimaritima sediminicola TaxID=2662066 RepID=UPI001386EA6D|nr:LuxR C-terminal-related transcriptional regulator [Roseimaritima sediminicola]
MPSPDSSPPPDIPPADSSTLEDQIAFARLVDEICSRVTTCLAQNGQLNSVLEAETTPVFIKGGDFRLLYTNPAYVQMFAQESVPVGRVGGSFLDDSLAAISDASDALISQGADRLIFDHFGSDSSGRRFLFRTGKRVISDKHNPGIAMLGVAKLIKIVGADSNPETRRLSLAQQWDRFQKLDTRDREIAVALARGDNLMVIAERHGITKRTVENRRNHLLERIGLNSPLDLAKAMVRFQENGFADFHV